LGRIAPDDAREFALVLMFLSTLLLGVALNWVAAAAILAFAQWFYAVFYTVYLKRRTPQNIVIGGAAGAFPPIIAWVSVTGQCGVGAGPLFPDHLPVDAAAFLGAGTVQQRGLRARECADAACRQGPATIHACRCWSIH
jgi:4-hydroxybenzoate polyprenyltransferase